MADDERRVPGAEDRPRRAAQPDLLGEMRSLRRQARAARHAYWFPLILFGLLTWASAPLYRQPALQPLRAGSGGPARATGVAGSWSPFFGGSPALEQDYLAYYWIAALLGGVLLTIAWYWWHARRVGLQTTARGYLVATIALAAAALAIPPLSRVGSPRWLRFLHQFNVLWPGDLVNRGTFPFFIIAVGFIALAWAERSQALAVITVVYTAAALLASLYDVGNIVGRLGWNPPAAEQSLPSVLLPGLVLLAAGAGTFAARRRGQAAV